MKVVYRSLPRDVLVIHVTIYNLRYWQCCKTKKIIRICWNSSYYHWTRDLLAVLLYMHTGTVPLIKFCLIYCSTCTGIIIPVDWMIVGLRCVWTSVSIFDLTVPQAPHIFCFSIFWSYPESKLCSQITISINSSTFSDLSPWLICPWSALSIYIKIS
jgi:hypothetical protein